MQPQDMRTAPLPRLSLEPGGGQRSCRGPAPRQAGSGRWAPASRNRMQLAAHKTFPFQHWFTLACTHRVLVCATEEFFLLLNCCVVWSRGEGGCPFGNFIWDYAFGFRVSSPAAGTLASGAGCHSPCSCLSCSDCDGVQGLGRGVKQHLSSASAVRKLTSSPWA